MNERDSEVVKGLLLVEGYQWTDEPDEADVVLFNTCSVRAHAEDRVWSHLGKLKKIRPGEKKKVVGVIGCMAQNYKEEIFKRAPFVDIVCGPNSIGNLALYLKEALRRQKKVMATGEEKRKDEIYHTGFYEDKKHAYVVISEGCDNFCSYCVVPYVRGRLRHRDAQDILAEVKKAVACGIENITFLGQNVNSYKSSIDFVGLLASVSEVPGLKVLSFITSHPKDISEGLFRLMAERPVIKRYLHLPVQSGSDRILALMNRGYTAKRYREIVDQYRSIVYNGKLSTDIIVGFPGETDDDFKKTYELAKDVRFDSAYLFKYSPRPNTKSALMDDDVKKEVKIKRHAQLLDLQKRIAKEGR
jgi:tRNA-2-methylthio-N6-dimethylallyladenosine synthase